MSRADDLAPLLAPPPEPAFGFRQGTILSFDQSNGANTVNVAGTVLTNVPIISGSESLEFSPGDVVVLLRFASSWAILGRVVIPGGAAFATSALATSGIGIVASNFALSTSPTAIASDTFVVPPWSNLALVTAIVSAHVEHPNASATEFVRCRATIDGSPGGDVSCAVAPAAAGHPGKYGTLAASAIRGTAVTPGGSFTVTGDVWAVNGAWAARAGNRCNLDAIAIFQRL